MFLINLVMVSDRREQSLEASVKFSSRLTIRNPSRLHLSSNSLPGVLVDMEAPDEPRDGIRWEHSLESSVKFSSRLTIRNPVQTPTVL